MRPVARLRDDAVGLRERLASDVADPARRAWLDAQLVALETQAVIGWNLTSTWFQRRAGLTTVVATMAGGRQSVTVLDVPEPLGVALARDGVPGLVEQFLA